MVYANLQLSSSQRNTEKIMTRPFTMYKYRAGPSLKGKILFHNYILKMANLASNLAQKSMGEVPVKVANEDTQAHAGTDMLACIWEAKDKVAMKRVPKPDVTDDEDVLIRITGSTGTMK
jgi:hypothetical protein